MAKKTTDEGAKLPEVSFEIVKRGKVSKVMLVEKESGKVLQEIGMVSEKHLEGKEVVGAEKKEISNEDSFQERKKLHKEKNTERDIIIARKERDFESKKNK